ncbi:MAG: HNH endonuclease [Gemmataceae bacterium]|nr:HNH endonuclease [Gemmataceae bacterium]
MNRSLQRLVRDRADDCCECCGMPDWAEDIPFQIDHIVAQQHGGLTTANNLSYRCLSCNKHKGPNLAGIDPLTKRVACLFNPRRQSWRRYFKWREPLPRQNFRGADDDSSLGRQCT